MRIVYLLLLFSLALAKPEGEITFENNCLRCHQEGSVGYGDRDSEQVACGGEVNSIIN